MRTPGNPVKNNLTLTNKFKIHRIIIPVYIPSLEGYYKDAYKIFCYSIDSLIRTIDPERVNITLINNSSIKIVDTKIRELLDKGLIDQYIFNLHNRGKGDAIISAAKGSFEPFITISDADVFFKSGWLEEIEMIYLRFPSAGSVCPFPAPHLKFYFTSFTWLRNSFRIKYNKIVDDKELDLLNHTIKDDLIKKHEYNKQFFIKSKGTPAIIGSGHFVATFRKIIFSKISLQPSYKGLKGELRKIDQLVDLCGFQRLSTTKNFVIHMGNVFEDWMDYEVTQLSIPNKLSAIELKDEYKSIIRIPHWVNRLLNRFFLYVIYSIKILKK